MPKGWRGRGILPETAVISHADMDIQLKRGDISLAVEIPPDFGKDILKGNAPSVSAWIDGAMPFRAETIGGYMQGLHLDFIQRLYHMTGERRGLLPVAPSFTVPV